MRVNKTLELKFTLMFFGSVYPTRPYDTVTRWKDYSNDLGSYFVT